MPTSPLSDFGSDDALFDQQAATFDVISHEQSNGASVTEGWADSHGNPAHHQVDFFEDEQRALGLSDSAVPEDQKKSYSLVAVIAIVFFVAAVAAIAMFVGAR